MHPTPGRGKSFLTDQASDIGWSSGWDMVRSAERYNTVRNFIFRQMLKMQDKQGMQENDTGTGSFPTTFCSRKRSISPPAKTRHGAIRLGIWPTVWERRFAAIRFFPPVRDAQPTSPGKCGQKAEQPAQHSVATEERARAGRNSNTE